MKTSLKILSLWLLVATAKAEIQTSEYTQTRIGEIQSVDHAKKTAVISGYRYGFTGIHGYDKPAVSLYGSNHGAFSMLLPGMRVRVVYRLADDHRVVVELEQVPDTVPLGVPDEH